MSLRPAFLFAVAVLGASASVAACNDPKGGAGSNDKPPPPPPSPTLNSSEAHDAGAAPAAHAAKEAKDAAPPRTRARTSPRSSCRRR